MKIDLYTQNGDKNGSVDLPKEIFEVEINEGLIHEALLRQQGNSRKDLAYTKTRADVRGGGKKPWRQKGTGRARQGTIRAGQWKGGGIIFGPRAVRNYEKNMPKKMRRKALFSALSSRAKDNAIVALEQFQNDTPKTKVLRDLLAKLKAGKRILIIEPKRNEILEKSARNIPGVKTIFAQYLNVQDLLTADKIIFLKEAVEKTKEIFGNKK